MDKRIKNIRMFPVVDNFRKCLIKVGDEVKIVAGADKGKIGKILDFDRKRGKVKVAGINIQTHFHKKTQEGPGKIEKSEGFIDISNVMFLENGLTVRLGKNSEGKRISMKTKKEI